jgi:DUF1707 SHOCT-like domain
MPCAVQPRYAVLASGGEEAPEMTDPGQERAAAARGRGRLLASGADREQVIELLKVAFIQDRLTQDELDTRVGLALASRTYADLADLTADIPAGSAFSGPAAGPGSALGEPAAAPASTPARMLAIAACRSVMCMLLAFAVVGVVALTNSESLVPVAFLSGIAAVIAASGFLGYGVVDAWQARGSRGHLPPRRGGRVLEDGRSASTGSDQALPGARTDQTRADLRIHQPGQDRRRPSGRCSGASRGRRPVPCAG